MPPRRPRCPLPLQAAIGESLGTSVSAAGYSQQAKLTASRAAPGDEFGDRFGAPVVPAAQGPQAAPCAPSREPVRVGQRHGYFVRAQHPAAFAADDGGLHPELTSPAA